MNIRAVYKALYDKVSPSSNDTMLILGLVACISLPLIGLFDEVNYLMIHGAMAGLFFGSAMIYEIWLTVEL